MRGRGRGQGRNGTGPCGQHAEKQTGDGETDWTKEGGAVVWMAREKDEEEGGVEGAEASPDSWL